LNLSEWKDYDWDGYAPITGHNLLFHLNALLGDDLVAGEHKNNKDQSLFKTNSSKA